MKSRRRESKAVTALLYLFLIMLSVICLFPVQWIVMASLNTGNALYSSSLVPEQLTLSHYRYLFDHTDYVLWFWNTFKIACMNMGASLVVVTAAAYAVSRFRFTGREIVLTTLMVLQMFPSFMAMISVYILLLQAGLLDTHLGLVLVYVAGGSPIGIWIVKGYMDGIPKSLEETARIDGASHTTVFVRVIAPLCVPILSFVALTSFIAPWMDFILPRLLLRSSEKKTLAIGLFEMVMDKSQMQFTTFAAGAVLLAIPITLLFFFLQRYVIDGLTAGASKG
ncbi:sugar ABC transporter permease [Paenibacillus methanolicus]|uniref:Arabinogalactan oligomer/maltooligosaccharide transport system permease protein n=1 Tax=Paenibacillus methanolicus TaxID=582686 RepID=A0A5S5CJU2_9BACL|nr:sugar ABC transporter permease [Paenibacillus methanolicus]TYP79005.1 arabinogalactan oligomer/maltooligosaccharide transport system permease protein [Paenibacillus methanolicus]